jgi:GNAT superfamily N-acetyltransferase
MRIINSATLTLPQKQAIFRLWNNEYPAQLAHAHMDELDKYLDKLGDQRHYFAFDRDNNILGWAFTFERENQKWFAIIVDRTTQGKGAGSLLLQKLMETATTLNGWVTDHYSYTRTDGSPYPSPLGFYEKYGFTVCNDTRLETEKLSAVKIAWACTTHAIRK